MVYIQKGNILELADFIGLPEPIASKTSKEGLHILMEYARGKHETTSANASTDTGED